MTVLFISSLKDIHSIVAYYILKQNNIETFFWSPELLPNSSSVSTKLSDNEYNKSIVCTVTGSYAENIDRVILRKWGKVDASSLHPDDQNIAISEFKRFLYGSMHFLAPDAVWSNPWPSFHRADSKALQLYTAQKSGFEIPETLMSNDPEEIRNFTKYHGIEKVIYKPYELVYWDTEDAGIARAMTNTLSSEILQDNFALQNCPGIYQKMIDKKYELRLHIFGNCIVPTRISQNNENRSTDIREDINKIILESVEISSELYKKCMKFMNLMNISFGVMDLIIDKNDNLYFLENNISGNFLWTEYLLPEIRLLDNFIEFILNFGNNGMQKNIKNYSFKTLYDSSSFKNSYEYRTIFK